MRILLSAFSCAPGRGSEPSVGWNVAQQAACLHDTWVMTDSRNRELIEGAAAGISNFTPHFIYIDLPSRITRYRDNKWFHYVYYLIWQLKAFITAWQLNSKHRFDIVHHVTYVNPWLPTWLGWLDVPFVWSAGNREPTPRSFLSEMSWHEAIWESLRNLALALSKTTSPLIIGRHAKSILSASSKNQWPKGLPIVPFALGGLDARDLQVLGTTPPRRAKPFRVLSEGRFLGLKGFAMGMRAFARLHQSDPESEYWLIGEGPEESHLRELARRLGVEKGVKFLPWIPREAALNILGEVDIVMQPSLHEQFGYVILEAMAAGKPVICLDAGGPSLLVEDDCGIKLPVTHPAQVVDGLVGALEHLATNPGLRLRMGEAGRRHAFEKWNWESVCQRLFAFYQ
jgi:glycosyltransferase involved in cell wall biosynthesis